MPVFCTPLDLTTTSLASGYTAGAGTLAVTAGTGVIFGTPSSTAPVRLTVVAPTALNGAGQIIDVSKVVIFRCTSRSTDSLTVTVESGSDQNLAAGSRVSVEVNAQSLDDIHDAIQGGSVAVVSKTTTYTASDADCVILCSTSGGAWTLSLPTAAGRSGKVFHVKKTDASGLALTVDGNGSQTIDGALTQVITDQYVTLTIVSDGSNWMIL